MSLSHMTKNQIRRKFIDPTDLAIMDRAFTELISAGERVAIKTDKGWFTPKLLTHGKRGRIRWRRVKYLDRQEPFGVVNPGSQAVIENLTLPEGL